MSKLSLKARKSVQESEEKRTEQLARLKEASGETWEFDFDWNAIATAYGADGQSTDDLGNTFNYISEAVTNALVQLCQDDIGKDTLLDEVDKKNIKFIFNKNAKFRGGYGYFESSIKDGGLIITIKDIANVDEAGRDITKLLGQKPGSLPLIYRQNIRNEEQKRTEHAEKIKNALGVDYTFDLDWAALFTGADDATEEGWRLPQSITYYTDAISNRIEGFAKDEMAKEQFLEETQKRTIKFIFDKKAKGDFYVKEAIQDGVLILTIKYVCNVDDTGRNILKLLGNGPGQIPLIVRMNIRDYEEKRQAHLERIREKTGVPDIEWDFDWNAIVTAIESSDADRIGETYEAYCSAVADRFERLCSDEMVKEALVDAMSAKKIKFVFNKNAKIEGYTTSAFVDGVLVFTTKYICNVSDVGSDIESLL